MRHCFETTKKEVYLNIIEGMSILSVDVFDEDHEFYKTAKDQTSEKILLIIKWMMEKIFLLSS